VCFVLGCYEYFEMILFVGGISWDLINKTRVT
jgi:hypothetical protein